MLKIKREKSLSYHKLTHKATGNAYQPAVRNLGQMPSDRKVRESPCLPLNFSGVLTAFNLICTTQNCWEHLLGVNQLEKTNVCLGTGLGLANVLVPGNKKKGGVWEDTARGDCFLGEQFTTNVLSSQSDKLKLKTDVKSDRCEGETGVRRHGCKPSK